MLFSLKRIVSAILIAGTLATAATEAVAQTGRASWYALDLAAPPPASACNPEALTAAHRSLPFGTRVKVDNLDNGKSVVVRINDRGPFVGGRIIDVTRASAQKPRLRQCRHRQGSADGGREQLSRLEARSIRRNSGLPMERAYA